MVNPFTTTVQVWHAIFLREALDRLFGVRAAWVWLVVEPTVHILFISIVWTVLRRRNMGGVDTALWIIVGMLAFFLFRRTAIQTMHSIDCNRAFFAFRQVRPFDASFVRAGVEAFVMTFISLFLFTAAAFTGRNPLPHDPLAVIAAVGGLWLLGLGYGLVASVIMRLVPEMTHILQIFMMPLYLMSCVILPIAIIPPPYRDWLMYNPIAHGLEAGRMAFFANYHTVPGVSLSYLYLWALCLLCLGLALYRCFETRLVMQ
jgi:capsular polysaccharide transport system permease protein